MSIVDLIWTIIAFIITLMVLSYAVAGDNPLFRLATHAFIGMAAAYLALVMFTGVFWPRFVLTIFRGDVNPLDKALLVVPLVLCVMMLFKALPRLSTVGMLPTAYLVGAGAATMIAGVVMGTLIPQVQAAVNAFDLHAGRAQTVGVATLILEGLILLAGTIATLIYFQFSAAPRKNQLPQRGALVENIARVGEVFIAITLGALFAGVYSAALTALIERLSFAWHIFF